MSLSHCDCEWEQCSTGAVKHWQQADGPSVETNSWNVAATVYLRRGGWREGGPACWPDKKRESPGREGLGHTELVPASPTLLPDLRSAWEPVSCAHAEPTARGCSARTHFKLGSLCRFFSQQMSRLCFKRKKERRQFFLLVFDAKTHCGPEVSKIIELIYRISVQFC